MRTVPFNQPINQCTKKWKGKCNLEQNIENENAIWKVQGSMYKKMKGPPIDNLLVDKCKISTRFVEVIFILSFIAQIWKGFIIIIIVSVSS
jgi:hypothetical protein